MLHKKYGDRIFQITFHKDLRPPPHHEGPEPNFDKFIEDVIQQSGKEALGFDIRESPFAHLRDRNTQYFRFQPNVCFADITDGYLYLESVDESEICTWWDGYITKEMLLKNKPYYESLISSKLDSTVRLKDAEDTNSYFRKLRDRLK